MSENAPARWYCGSSAETVNSRELDRLMDGYRQDGAEVTRDRDGGYNVRFSGQESRSYDRVPDVRAGRAVPKPADDARTARRMARLPVRTEAVDRANRAGRTPR